MHSKFGKLQLKHGDNLYLVSSCHLLPVTTHLRVYSGLVQIFQLTHGFDFGERSFRSSELSSFNGDARLNNTNAAQNGANLIFNKSSYSSTLYMMLCYCEVF